MKDEPTYRESVDIQRMEKLRLIERELPIVCTDFFRSIAHTTSLLTRLAYAYDYRLFFDYLKKENYLFADIEPAAVQDAQLRALKGRDIEGYQDYLGQYYKQNDLDNSVQLIRNHELGIMRKLCSLRSLFEYLYKTGHVEANITTLITLPKLHAKPILRLEADEMRGMIEAAESGEGLTDRQKKLHQKTVTRDTAIILLFLGTGIRVSECVGLDIDDLDFDLNAFLVTRKGGNQTVLYFPDQVASALQIYLTDRKQVETLPGHERALFLSLQKRRITQRAVENLVKKYALIAAPLKKRLSPHKLRSTFGTNLYQETGDIYLVADVLGHADVNTTRRHYADMTDQRKRMAAKYVVLPKTGAAEQGERVSTPDEAPSISLNADQEASNTPAHAFKSESGKL